MTTTQVPINAVEADQLPRENAIRYEDMCRLIGDLYFKLHHQENIQQEQFKAMSKQMQERIQKYIAENERLKSEIARYERSREEVSPSKDNG